LRIAAAEVFGCLREATISTKMRTAEAAYASAVDDDCSLRFDPLSLRLL